MSVATVDTPEELSALHRPGCVAVLWWRQPITSFQDWIDALAPEQLPTARLILCAQDVRPALTSISTVFGTPECAERSLLIDDVAALAEIFAGLMRASHLRLRLDVMTSNACRDFQFDPVPARLICTYRGTGTQYSISTDVVESRQVFTVPTGVPIVMRGAYGPGHLRSGLRYRAPPIEGLGETRLVLDLDPVRCQELPTHQLPH